MLKCCLSPHLALKQPMPFLSPPHVPALFIYPTTPGIVKVYVSFVEILFRFTLLNVSVNLVLFSWHCIIFSCDVTFLASRPFFSFAFCPAVLRFARRSCAMPHTTVWPSTQTWAHGKSDLCCFIEQTSWMEESCQVYHNNISWMPIHLSCI